MEHGRYFMQRLLQVDAGLSQEEQKAALTAIEKEVKQHMKQWVIERDSG
jgi:hypothetical protein